MNDSLPQAPLEDIQASRNSLGSRLKDAWNIEFSNFRWRLFLCTQLMRFLPQNRCTGLRTSLVRAIGLNVGRGTKFLGAPKIQSNAPGPLRPRLQIGSGCTIGAGAILEFGEVLTIGDRVTLADGVVILTTTHQLGPKEHRAGPVVRSPVVIGNEVEIGEGAIVLPGAKIGDGARVMANSVVNANVGPGITVTGIPARPVKAAVEKP